MALRPVRVLLLGFGNVGQAVAEMVLSTKATLAASGLEIVVAGVSTGSHGCALTTTAAGVSLADCLERVRAAEDSGDGKWRLPEGDVPVDSTDAMLNAAAAATAAGEWKVDAVLEAVPANFDTGEPALSFLHRALTELNAHAITASKGPVLHGVTSLTAAAEAADRRFLFESSVMDGIPIFSLLRQMPAVTVTGFDGILNSTTNIILTEMEEKQCTFDEALAKAQRAGIAERDPSGDIDGHDAATKVAVLGAVLLGSRGSDWISVAGIDGIGLDEVNAAKARGCRMKLVCSCSRKLGADGAQSVTGAVELKELPLTDPLSSMNGSTAVVKLYFDELAPISIVSHDPENADTAYGLFADLLTAVCGDGSRPALERLAVARSLPEGVPAM